MRVRARLPTNASGIVIEVKNDCTVGNFIQEIANSAKLTKSDIKVKYGFPPVNSLSVDDDSLVSSIISDGDVVVVINKEMDNVQARAQPGETFASNDELVEPKKRGGRSTKSYGGEDDLSLHLIDVMGRGGGGLSSQEKGLRKAFKLAMDRRQQSTKAEHRWTAWNGKKYKITNLPSINGIPKFKVVYRVERHDVEEVYTAFPKQLLSAVLQEVWKSDDVDSKRNLKTELLAEAQPMIFWGLVRLFEGDVIKGLEALIPGLNYEQDLNKREIKYSQKYLENITQENKYGENFEYLEEVRAAEAAEENEQRAIAVAERFKAREAKKGDDFVKRSLADAKKESSKANGSKFVTLGSVANKKRKVSEADFRPGDRALQNVIMPKDDDSGSEYDPNEEHELPEDHIL